MIIKACKILKIEKIVIVLWRNSEWMCILVLKVIGDEWFANLHPKTSKAISSFVFQIFLFSLFSKGWFPIHMKPQCLYLIFWIRERDYFVFCVTVSSLLTHHDFIRTYSPRKSLLLIILYTMESGPLSLDDMSEIWNITNEFKVTKTYVPNIVL